MRGVQVLGQGGQVLGKGIQVLGQGVQEPGYSMLPSTVLMCTNIFTISSGVSSGSGSSDTGSNGDKCESPTPSATPSHGSSNTVKRRPDSNRPGTRPRHLKPKKDIYKNNNNNSNGEI